MCIDLPSGVTDPQGLAVNANGDLYVADSATDGILHCNRYQLNLPRCARPSLLERRTLAELLTLDHPQNTVVS